MPDLKPKFNPNAPYKAVEAQTVEKPPFNPNEPYNSSPKIKSEEAKIIPLTPEVVQVSETDKIIDNIPDVSGYQKNHIKDLAQKGANQEQLSSAIQAFQKQNEKDIHVWSDKPRASYGEYAYNKLAAGSAKVGSMLAKTPTMIYDLAAKAMNESIELSMPFANEELLKQSGAHIPYSDEKENALFNALPENKIAKYYDEDVKKRQEVAATRYDKSIEEYISQGDYSKAVGAISGSVLESAPVTISLMMGNAAGIGEVASTVGGGVVFAADKKSELDNDEGAKNLTHEQKLNIALSNGLFEGLFEQFGITKLGSLTKNALLRGGKEEARKVALDGFKNVYLEPLKKYVGVSLAEESLSEAATQFAQNAVDKYSGYKPDLNLKEGVVDAAIVGLASGGLMGAVPAKIEVGANKRTNEYAKILQKEDLVKKENIKSEHAFQVSQQGEETISAFESNVDNAVANGNLTLEEGEKAKHRVRAYQQYGIETQDLKLDDKNKRKIFDLSYQQQGLQSEVPEDVVEKDLNPIERAKRNAKQSQIKALQKDIDALVLDAQTKGEAVLGSKTEGDVAKNKEKGITGTPISDKEAKIAERNAKYKEETGYLPSPTREELKERAEKKLPLDTRKMTEVDPFEFNKEKSQGERGYNHRIKFAQTVEHIDSKPEGKEQGVLKLVQTKTKTKAGKFVPNTLVVVEMPSGHQIRTASSMIKEEGFRGHFREEHLPKGKKMKDSEVDEAIDNFPVGMKIVKTSPGINGEHTAVKIYNAKTGKFLSWAKATTKGEDALQQPVISADDKFAGKKGITKQEKEGEIKRREDLERESVRDEPIDNGNNLPPTNIEPTNTPPVKPIVPVNVQTTNETTETTDSNTSNSEGIETTTDNLDSGPTDEKSSGEEKTLRKERTKNIKVKDPNRLKALGIEVYNPYDIVMQYFIGGGKLNSKAFRLLFHTEAQVAEEKPLDELKGRSNYVTPSSKVTIDGLAHDLWEQNRDITQNFESDDFKNAIEDVLKDEPASTIEMAKNLINKYKDKQQIEPNTEEENALSDGLKKAEEEGVLDEVENDIEKLEELPTENLEEGIDIIVRDDLKDDAFQKQKAVKGSFDAEHHERVLKVTQHIQKILPKMTVKYNPHLKASGKLSGNTIEINPYYANTDTPIHEAAHVLLDAIGHDNVVIQEAIRQIKATPKGQAMWERVQKDYSELDQRGQENELLAEAIGVEGASIFDTEIEKGKFRQLLDYIFNWFKRKLGLEKNIVKSLAKQIISGKGLKSLEGIGGKSKEQIVGEKAKLKKEIVENKNKAEILEASGETAEKIRMATGWERGKDGMWRYELGDENAKIIPTDKLVNALNNVKEGQEINVGNLSDIYSYDELYEAYPELKNIKIKVYYGEGNENGGYSKEKNEISINRRLYPMAGGKETIREDSEYLRGLRILFSHETQHAIQATEGFEQGGSPKVGERVLREKYYNQAVNTEKKWKTSGKYSPGLNFFINQAIMDGESEYPGDTWKNITHRAYERLAGEVEARNVTERLKLSDEEKKLILLRETEDVDRAVQIITRGSDEAKYQKPKYEKVKGEAIKDLSEFRTEELNRNTETEAEDIEYANEIIKDKTSTEKEIKDAQGLKNTILNRQREDKKKYADYLSQVKTAKDFLEDDGLEDYSYEELMDIYNNSHYSMDNDSPLNKAVKLRIAINLEQQQQELLAKNPLWEQKKENVNQKDLSGIQLFFKSLADIPEYLPGLQVLGKELNGATLAKATEIRERGQKLTSLAKAVIKEKNGMLGLLHPKGVFSSDSAKYFQYLDNGKGQLISAEEASGLTKAQKEFRDYMQELIDLRNTTYDENDNVIANDLMKVDKGFREAWRTEGFLPAVANYLGKGINTDLLLDVNGEKIEHGDAQQQILSNTNTFKDKLKAGVKLAQLAYKARRNKDDAPYFNYRGALTSKFDRPRTEGKGYSKDFFAAGLSLINDYAHVKHMSPLVPIFDSVHYLYEKGFDANLPNVRKFIESEMNDKLYQKQKGFEPTVDATLKFLRRLGSLTTMAFNIPANAVNIAIGNYNNWRQEGLPHILKGNARLFTANGKLGKKGLDVLKMFDVVKFDADSNPQINGAKMFDKLAYFFNKVGEYQIQGSMFLGHLSTEEWNSFQYKDGKLQLKEGVDKKAFTDKMASYKDAVSAIQGKYDEKDRRMFMRGEIGKSVATFKTWMPDAIKSRFGKEFINKYGMTERGSFNYFTRAAIAELRNDISANPLTWLNNKQTNRNLRGAIVVATLYTLTHSGSDDDKKKKEYYETLSLENTLGNVLFLFDTSQLKYLVENPVAIKGTVVKFIDALDAAIHGDTKKLKKNLKKLTPYGKAVYPILEGHPEKVITGGK